MKIIDLLNKIAKGENFDNCKMKFNVGEPELVNEYVIYEGLYEEDFTLNDELEIIIEEKDIEELPPYVSNADLLKEVTMNRNKINEIVRKLKDLSNAKTKDI